MSVLLRRSRVVSAESEPDAKIDVDATIRSVPQDDCNWVKRANNTKWEREHGAVGAAHAELRDLCERQEALGRRGGGEG